MEGNIGRLFLGRDWESSLTGLELVQETTNKVVLVKEKLKVARDRQKSYVNYGRKPLEFKGRDCVLLKVPPWKCVVRFGKKACVDIVWKLLVLQGDHLRVSMACLVEGEYRDDKKDVRKSG
ncbi:hypothetical protein Tco_0770041 [Tanacetum coccineum]|uniref:Reverse transcriptase domain-containing protein n=1 Tax=Tanacetum coccineum TaxID=301880 RepID=A0ABQ4ZBC5_9ASTR